MGWRGGPGPGRAGGDEPDSRHQWRSVGCKERRRLPDWLNDALEQAKAAARGHQLPVAILHEAGTRYSSAFVVIELAEFCEWFGD